jgi:PhoPQ-activated pathogenicity-related protein
MKSQYRKSIYKLVLPVVLFAGLPGPVFGTALDDYVKKPDASYMYSVVNTIEGKGYTAYVIDMTSQSWRSEKEVDRTLWKHWVTIIKPDKVKSDIGLLWITGGSNNNDAPKSADMMLAHIALATGTVVTDLRMVPNQPLNFPDGGRPRYEDAIIAYTFDKCITTGDLTWALLLPMAKSAVRAMDTVQKHVRSEAGGGIAIQKFVVSGASKRGWTTWLTAAVDKRVAAIAPAVIDVLNMKESMRHHFSAYGFYAPAIHDYQEMKIFDRLWTKKGEELRKLIDPYEYRKRYTMPKFLVNSTGDQFFLPDSAQFYFNDLPSEKYLRYIPNTDHGLDFSAAASLLLFYQSILNDTELPKFTWKVEGDKIKVKLISGKLKEVNLLQASNEKARDFRVDTIGRAWKSSPVEVSENAAGFDVGVDEPNEGWTAFFVEMVYDSGGVVPYKFTTQVHVVPERLPFADKFDSRSGEKGEKDVKVVFCEDQSFTITVPEGVEQVSSWSGTWKSDEEGGHGGALKCVTWRVDGMQWKARFAGYCSQQFFYEIAMTGREKAEGVVFSGDADLGEKDGKYTWRGKMVGTKFDGRYESEKGKTGSFTMQPISQ